MEEFLKLTSRVSAFDDTNEKRILQCKILVKVCFISLNSANVSSFIYGKKSFNGTISLLFRNNISG